MATYRKIAPAGPALIAQDFPFYNDALAYSRSIGGHKPIRKVTPEGLTWRVCRVNPTPAKPVYTRVADWDKPLHMQAHCPIVERMLAHLTND